MKHFAMALCALFIACDDSGNDSGEMVDGDGSLGVAVSELDKWGLESCPAGLEEVDGLCVAGTVDMQLDIDDCRAVAHCFKRPDRVPGVVQMDGSLKEGWNHVPSCAAAVVLATLDGTTVAMEAFDVVGETAQWAAYSSWSGRSPDAPDDRRGLHVYSSFNGMSGANRELILDRAGYADCLFAAEANVVQDRWKWSKVRRTLIERNQESSPELW